MRLNLAGGVIAAIIIVALIIAYGSLFTVYQTRQALVVRLGEPIRVVTQPGLHFKVPLIDSVIQIDKRILDLENPAQEVIASDQKRLVVDAFARYRIDQPLRFYQTVGSVDRANSQLSILLNSALRRVLGEATLSHVVRDERSQLMNRVRDQLNTEAQAFGISIVDVRIRRADLPEQNSQAVYQRMQTERQQEAAQIRAQGSQRAQEIRARADRDVTVLLADASRRASRRAARAMPHVTASMPRRSARIPSSSRSIGRCRLTKQGCGRTTRGCCSSPTRSSSVSSLIRPASRAPICRRRRLRRGRTRRRRRIPLRRRTDEILRDGVRRRRRLT